MSVQQAPPEGPSRRLSARGRALLAGALVVIAAAAVWGVLGLLASPVGSIGGDGVTTLHGTWEPYTCDATTCQGYIQAGARSVFVVFPSHCPAPPRAADITVRGRQDSALGKGSYRALGCSG